MLLAEIFENIRKDSINPYFFWPAGFWTLLLRPCIRLAWRQKLGVGTTPQHSKVCPDGTEFYKILTKFAYIFKLSKYERRFKNLLEKVGT